MLEVSGIQESCTLGRLDPSTIWQCCCFAGNATLKSNLSHKRIQIKTDVFIFFQLISDSAFIDRKIKFRIPPKSNVALRILRNQLGSLLANLFRGKVSNESQILWHELALMVLGKIKLKDPAEARMLIV